VPEVVDRGDQQVEDKKDDKNPLPKRKTFKALEDFHSVTWAGLVP
jgi:hypothetical protein